jgi:hypothetical protein
MKCYRVIPHLVAILLLTSCAFFRPVAELEITPADKVDEVLDLLSALRAQNNTLRNFKGIGNIRLSQKGRSYLNQRVAWMGEKPAKLSMVLLVSGYPAVKLATDGEWLYYLETRGTEKEYKKIRASDPSLKSIISIPISASDVVLLLTGSLPMPVFDSVELIEDETIPGFVLVLKEKWWGKRQKLFYDENQSRFYRIDVFQRSGALMYRAEIERIQQVDGFEVPIRLKLSSDNGNDLQLDIDRCWVNVDLPPSAFVLMPPE